MAIVLSERDPEQIVRYAGPRFISDNEMAEAESVVLCDVDSYSDWLAAACMNRSAQIGYVPRGDIDIANMIERQPVHCLVALTLYPRAEVAFAATQELRARYLTESADRIKRIAGDLAAEAA